MEKGFGVLRIKSIDEERRIVRGIASTPSVDRQGDIVEPMGVQYKALPKLMLYHDHRLPVGSLTFAKATKKGVEFEAHIPEVTEEGVVRDRVNEAWHSLKYNLISAVSIGFRVLEHEVMKTGGWLIKSWEWLELSLVPVPAQPDAIITGIKSVDSEIRAALGVNKDSEKAACNPIVLGKSGNSPITVKLKTKENIMSISKKLKGFQDELEVKSAELIKLGEKSAEDGQTFDEADQEAFDTLEKDIQTLQGHITRLEKAEKLAIATAKPVTPEAGADEVKSYQVRAGVQIKAREKAEPGIEFARYAMCLVAAKSNPQTAFGIAKSNYGEDSVVTRVLGAEAQGLDLTKAAVVGGNTTNSTWAAPLVDEFRTFAGDFIEYLRPRTIVGQFGTNGIPSLRRIPFNVRIAAQTSGATAAWVGEGAAKPVTKMDFNDVELRWAKIAAITVITEELIRFSDPAAERLVRDELARSVIERMDIDFVNPLKSANGNISPASITYGVSPIASTGTTAADIRCDINALFAGFDASNNPANDAVFIMSTTTARALSMMQNPLGQSEYVGLTARGGTFLGYPVIVSNYTPTDSDGHYVILVNASDIFLADDGQVTLDASREATIQMDSEPTQSSVTPTASAGVSMFQTNSVAIRAERYITWAKRRASAVQLLSGVNWGACA